MLKFRDDYTTLIATFEDFILLVFTMVDDLYKQFAPSSVSQRRNVSIAKMSDSEIIALSICSEVIGIDSEKAWYFFVKRNYRRYAPKRYMPYVVETFQLQNKLDKGDQRVNISLLT